RQDRLRTVHQHRVVAGEPRLGLGQPLGPGGRLRYIAHGAEAVLPLAQSWPLGPAAARLVRHTGYVAGPAADPLPGAGGEVLVAVGGGDLGRRLLDCAAEAAVRSPHLWRLRVGGADAAAHARALAARHPGATMVAEPAAADYRARLAAAACSVSLAGYNTVMDLAPLTTPAVLVPDTTGGEREQAIRAAALAGHPGIAVLELEALTPAQLAETVEALAGRARPPLPLALDGAERAAAALLALALPERSPAERSPAGRSPAERSTA
ncbi:MAG: glycosyltransferase, partial [Pseudomonadota bacterium]